MIKNYKVLLVASGVLATALPALAQAPAEGTASSVAMAAMSGTIQTELGIPLAGATVAVLHLPTGIRRTFNVGETGKFELLGLIPGGPYIVQVTQAGYRPQLISNLFLKAKAPVTFAFTLVPATVVVGTRRADRTGLESAVPVDVVDMRELTLTAPRTDVTQLLTYVVPSFNSNRETSADGADHVDASSLRGLGPDQMLVLVNGHRRHSSALINLLGSRGIGTSTTDLNTLPANALDQVEILRDGAAAQYGSDAIAGVMNFNLKSDNHGGNILVNNGIHSSGFGYNTTVSLNKGLKLGEKGFLNVTAEVDYRGRTTSSDYTRDLTSWPIFSDNQAREDSFLLANKKTQKDYRQLNGDAQILNVRTVYNAGIQLSSKVRFYSFGTYNFRRGRAVAPWVLPSTNPLDLTDRPGFSLGYQPDINTHINDGSAVLGFDLKLGRWALDLSQSIGSNRLRYDGSNTINPTMGPNSPTTFDDGGLQFTQAVTNATLTRLFDKVLAGTNVAVGTEFRNDRYTIVAGQPESYLAYPGAPVGTSGGAQGFIGFDPTSATASSRQNVAAFLDVEADVVKRWTVGGAVRYENYSDFAAATVFKATTRVQATKFLAVRGGYNTGFRAPSQQQRTYRQLTLLPTASSGTVYSAIFNNGSAIANAAGIESLTPEHSRNLSAGLVLTPAKNLVLTADAYQIDIDNRISLTNEFDVTSVPAIQQALVAQSQADITTVQFFANALNTRTRGLDVVSSYNTTLGRGSLRLTAAANFNETKLIGDVKAPAAFTSRQTDNLPGNDFIGQRQLSMITTGSPKNKVFGSATYEQGRFGATVRYTRFGEVSMYDFNFDALEEGTYYLTFRPKSVTDLILTYKPAKGFLLALGAQNIFNVLPDNTSQAALNGHPPVGFSSYAAYNAYFLQTHGYANNLPYDHDILPYHAVQMGANGAFFYLKASYSLGQ
ncbi:MAG: TonB-dependent receptor [Hymenobacter sp.]|nr:MAG: TonB-dependent receptor [Hymenobacter sp.]